MKHSLILLVTLLALSQQAPAEDQPFALWPSLTVATYTPADTTNGNANSAVWDQSASDVPTETVPQNSYYNFAKGWGKSTDCQDQTKIIYKYDLASPADMKYNYALKASKACGNVITGQRKAFEKVPAAAAQLCNAKLIAQSTSNKFHTCWTDAVGETKVLSAATVFAKLNIIPLTNWVQKAATAKESDNTWGTVANCVRQRNCWGDEQTYTGTSLNPAGEPTSPPFAWNEFTDKGPYVDKLYANALAAITAAAKCEKLPTIDLSATPSSGDIDTVWGCFESAYDAVPYDSDRGVIECLQQCVKPTNFFGYSNSVAQGVDGELWSEVNTEHVSQRLSVFTTFKACINKDIAGEFLWYDYDRKFEELGAKDNYNLNNWIQNNPQDRDHDWYRLKSINAVRNCFQQAKECNYIRNFWAAPQMPDSSYYFNSNSLNKATVNLCRDCLNFYSYDAPGATQHSISAAVKQDYANHENRAATAKYHKCFDDLINQWDAVIRKQNKSSSSVLMSALAGIIAIVALFL